MKRTFACVTILGLALSPQLARAQGGFGIKGGFSYGNVSNRGVLPGALTNRTGFAVGVGLSGTGLMGFGVEGLYAQRGVVSSTNGDSWKLDYVDLPVYLRVGVPTPGVAPFAYAGPQFSFEVSCNAGGGATCPDNGRPKTTYAAILGGGVRLGAQSGLTLEGRYIYGLNDLKLSTVTSSQSYKTRSFLILAGWSF
ncbi:MAG TPA: porin family protein [Gemmatimonadales bacterium]